ncbi:uncharacterized protein LOC114280260 [Camellia sinensis]|uniref:uncharacterized protein LOC114280260 n=1 Tax=Camellia sinensis TaxID=4442 RepID=UPI0010365467|nr:uncharacterized protein LOC114280260 [Camellia sinensis]
MPEEGRINDTSFFVCISCVHLIFVIDHRTNAKLSIQPGKYYLVNAGYKNQKGFLAPFKGCRYHQEQFRATGWPINANEIFNTVHSSLRSAIERTFGVWKARWGFLHNMPRYDFGKVQVPLVGTSMAIHNFIRCNSSDDESFNKVTNAENFTFNDMPNVDGLGDDDDGEPEGDDDVHMNEVRKSIRNELVRHRRQLGL